MTEPVESEVDSIHVPAHPASFALAVAFRIAIVGLAGWIASVALLPVKVELLLDARWALTALALVVYFPSLLRLAVPGSLRRRLEGNYGWVRGFAALAALGLLPLILRAPEHEMNGPCLALAAMILIDWLAIGRNQERLHRGLPVLWLLMASPWLGAQIAAGDRYDLFDPHGTYFGLIMIALLLGILAAGTLLLGIGRLKAALTGTSATVSARGSFTPLQW